MSDPKQDYIDAALELLPRLALSDMRSTRSVVENVLHISGLWGSSLPDVAGLNGDIAVAIHYNEKNLSLNFGVRRGVADCRYYFSEFYSSPSIVSYEGSRTEIEANFDRYALPDLRAEVANLFEGVAGRINTLLEADLRPFGDAFGDALRAAQMGRARRIGRQKYIEQAPA